MKARRLPQRPFCTDRRPTSPLSERKKPTFGRVITRCSTPAFRGASSGGAAASASSLFASSQAFAAVRSFLDCCSAFRARASGKPMSTSCLTCGSTSTSAVVGSWTRQGVSPLSNSTWPPTPSSAVAMHLTSGLPRSSTTSTTRNFTFGGKSTSLSLLYALNSLMSAGANSQTSSSYMPSGGSTRISKTICPQLMATFLSVVVEVKAVQRKSLPGL
mmetsp:Transcript_113234/g.352955  ORF Transcript_113234/g.352955 Transcript_113234/m.352955 type:complete len:216 (-) Transcript_113234:160-807(-)